MVLAASQHGMVRCDVVRCVKMRRGDRARHGSSRAISGGRACLPGIWSFSLRECAAGIVGKGTIGKLTTPRALTLDSRRSTGSLVFSLALSPFLFPSHALFLSRFACSLSPSSALFSPAIRTAFSSIPRRSLLPARPFDRSSVPFRSASLSVLS